MIWIIYSLIAALFFTFFHLTSKRFSNSISTASLFFMMDSFGVLFLLPFFAFVEPLTIELFWRFLVFMTCALGGFASLYHVYKNNEISAAAPLLNFSPLFWMATSFILFREVLTMMQLAGLLLIVIGGYIVTLKDPQKLLHPFTAMDRRDYLFMLLTLVLWGFGAPFAKSILILITPLSFVFYQFIFGFFIILIYILATKQLGKAKDTLKRFWWVGAAIAFFDILHSLFINMAVDTPGALVTLANTLKRTSSIFIVIIGGNLFREKNILHKTIACLIMLAGVFLIAFFS